MSETGKPKLTRGKLADLGAGLNKAADEIEAAVKGLNADLVLEDYDVDVEIKEGRVALTIQLLGRFEYPTPGEAVK